MVVTTSDDNWNNGARCKEIVVTANDHMMAGGDFVCCRSWYGDDVTLAMEVEMLIVVMIMTQNCNRFDS